MAWYTLLAYYLRASTFGLLDGFTLHLSLFFLEGLYDGISSFLYYPLLLCAPFCFSRGLRLEPHYLFYFLFNNLGFICLPFCLSIWWSWTSLQQGTTKTVGCPAWQLLKTFNCMEQSLTVKMKIEVIIKQYPHSWALVGHIIFISLEVLGWNLTICFIPYLLI